MDLLLTKVHLQTTVHMTDYHPLFFIYSSYKVSDFNLWCPQMVLDLQKLHSVLLTKVD